MWFDPYAFAEKSGSEGCPRANLANRANPHPPISTSSTISTGGPAGPAAAISTISTISIVPGASGEITDPDALLALLRDRGPMTYGAAASALGWGATRTWQAEAALRAEGKVRAGRLGRAEIMEGAQ
jgi:hypothetical protein